MPQGTLQSFPVVHGISFLMCVFVKGDCFEVAMQREKFPGGSCSFFGCPFQLIIDPACCYLLSVFVDLSRLERIPFRLTRMLVSAMEVSGIEGNFRSTCCSVMRVLRDNKESLMAVLEAFVYDPLINWRLLKTTVSPKQHGSTREREHEEADLAAGPPSPPHAASAAAHVAARGVRERELIQRLGPEGDAAPTEVLNERALSVISRVHNKLTGKDFENEVLDVNAQVRRLIRQATSHENLCQVCLHSPRLDSFLSHVAL